MQSYEKVMPKKIRQDPNSPNTFQILQAWDLLEEDPKLGRLSLKDWRSISHALDNYYSDENKIQASLGSVHLGVTQGITICEGRLPPTELASQLVLFETVWLPDPLYAFLAETARQGWSYLPETGSDYLSHHGIRPHWKHLWDVSPEQRRAAIRRYLPGMLATYRKLKPFADEGIIRLFPWEKLIIRYREDMRKAIIELKKHPVVEVLKTSFPSEKYSLSPLVFGIGMQAADPPPPGMKIGEPVWLTDSSPVLMMGILNNLFSFHTGSTFMPALPGDRVLYDFIASGGQLRPGRQSVGSPIPLPQLSNVMWPDLISIRKDAEVLAIFREIINQAAGAEGMNLPEIEERLREAAEKLRKDTTLTKITGGSLVYVMINMFVAVGAVGLMGGNDVHAKQFFAGLGAFVSEFLKRLYAGYAGDYKAKRNRRELLISIADRLT